MLERVKILGAVGMNLMYFISEKDMNLGPRGGTLWTKYLCPPKVHIEAINSQCDGIWRWDL